MNIRRIIREEINDLQWINDIKTNQDIAQEIADKSEIKNNKLYAPFPSFSFLPTAFFPSHSSFLFFSFTKYCKERYGLNDDDIKDVWNRYVVIIKDKIKNK